MFPFTLSGWVTVRGVRDPESVAPLMRERVMDMLENAYAGSVTKDANGDVYFSAGLFSSGTSNWGVLVPFGSGRIRVTPRRRSVVVTYRLSTTQMLVVVLAMLGLLAVVTFSPDHVDTWLRQTPSILAFGVAWLFGMNYLIGLIRFPIWLRAGLMRTLPPGSIRGQMLHSLRD